MYEKRKDWTNEFDPEPEPESVGLAGALVGGLILLPMGLLGLVSGLSLWYVDGGLCTLIASVFVGGFGILGACMVIDYLRARAIIAVGIAMTTVVVIAVFLQLAIGPNDLYTYALAALQVMTLVVFLLCAIRVYRIFAGSEDN